MAIISERFNSGYDAFIKAYGPVNISTLSYFFGVVDDKDERRVLIQCIREVGKRHDG
jgi:hypothetical protein